MQPASNTLHHTASLPKPTFPPPTPPHTHQPMMQPMHYPHPMMVMVNPMMMHGMQVTCSLILGRQLWF